MAQLVKEFAYNAGDVGLIPGLGRSPGEGNGYPLQYSGLENLIIGLPQDWGKQRLQSWRAQNLVHAKTERKGAVTLQETEPKLSASVGGLL